MCNITPTLESWNDQANSYTASRGSGGGAPVAHVDGGPQHSYQYDREVSVLHGEEEPLSKSHIILLCTVICKRVSISPPLALLSTQPHLSLFLPPPPHLSLSLPLQHQPISPSPSHHHSISPSPFPHHPISPHLFNSILPSPLLA